MMVIIFTWHAHLSLLFCIVLLHKATVMKVLNGTLFSALSQKKISNLSDTVSFGGGSSYIDVCSCGIIMWLPLNF